MTQRRQVTPGNLPPMQHYIPPVDDERLGGMSDSVREVIGALKQDLLPLDVQMQIVNSMSPAARREMVAKIAGLEASVLMTFRQQITLVDTVLRRIVNDDGTVTPSAEDYDIPLKDALNLSLKVTQVMVRDLPKIYSLDRIQRQEEALRRVMETHLSRDQQEALLLELERIEHGVE
ncbi:hypothetical protein OF001_U20275 [Pseudomonas sp. OF001]|uniref:hypothetical protein n=1 Tax=Pseudomonas sp. OF001 TaxID=2772300 RepID=UPI00191B8E0E|nr:hypothetical protein [Pseudomonas sp. OF001]CAD5377348.1 hypothetical protein OF001_U20275 [Pseudomonas sp. OF001]